MLMLAGAGAGQHLREEAGVHSSVVVVDRIVGRLVGNIEHMLALATS